MNDNIQEIKATNGWLAKTITAVLVVVFTLSGIVNETAVYGKVKKEVKSLQKIEEGFVNRTKKVDIFVEKNRKIKIYGVEKIFVDDNEKRLYPISYRNTTYIPVRIVAEISNQDIDWVDETRTIFVGKTLKNPNKLYTDRNIIVEFVRNKEASKISEDEKQVDRKAEKGFVRTDTTLLYDFQFVEMQDSKGRTLPIVYYKNRTYLPVRFLADLLKQNVSWLKDSNTIEIGSDDYVKIDNLSQRMKNSKWEWQQMIEIYDAENNLIVDMDNKKTVEAKREILQNITKGLNLLKKDYKSIKNRHTEHYGIFEKQLHEKVCKSLEDSIKYIEVLENIAYMKVEEKDFSVMIDSMKKTYIQSQESMDEVRDFIEFVETKDDEEEVE